MRISCRIFLISFSENCFCFFLKPFNDFGQYSITRYIWSFSNHVWQYLTMFWFSSSAVIEARAWASFKASFFRCPSMRELGLKRMVKFTSEFQMGIFHSINLPINLFYAFQNRSKAPSSNCFHRFVFFLKTRFHLLQRFLRLKLKPSFILGRGL